ncbi:growth arrest-specific protein 1 [Ambystoma mexicanum]|uniref:growth arrest-specific protein 1 n=1 Tax=Ambystoma mexicanum TaxID=8296 RepID=UPI0037E836A5
MAGARVLLMALLLGASAGRRLICWQALLQCQDEPDCSYAYNLYSAACAPVLPHRGDPSGRASASSGRRCPSHCISALIQLNQTRRGPALEECDCAQDASCRATKSAIEPCLPRTGGGGASSAAAAGPRVLGCTEARRRCEQDHRCNAAMGSYLAHCGKLFNGRRCTHECRDVIQDMLTLPKARLLSECVCDGLDRPICEAVKENMARLCFGQDPGHYQPGDGSSGGSSLDLGFDEYYDEEYEEEAPVRTGEPPERPRVASDNSPTGGYPAAAPFLLLVVWTSAASILWSLLWH